MSSRWQFSLYFLIAVISIAIVAVLADRQTINNHNSELKTDIIINLHEMETLLLDEYRGYKEDITFLFKTPPISGLTRASENTGVDPLDGTTTELWKNRLAQIFISFMESNPSYFQLRLLDAQGKELVRVDKSDGRVIRRPDNDLQDKSDRFYFSQSSQLAEGQLFISRIDLNRENGDLQFPYIPTLRLARPVYTDNNTFFGELVMNIDVSTLFNALNQVVTNKYDVMIYDNDGYFVKHFDESLQYSRDLAPDKTIDTTYEQYPQSNTTFTVFQNDDSQWVGQSTEVTVAANKIGGHLTAAILLSSDKYNHEISQRRLQSWFAIVVILLIALTALFFLHRNNLRLSKLLSKSEEAEAAVDVAEDAIITVDINWQINSVNRAFERLFLLHADEVHRTSLPELLHKLGDPKIRPESKLDDSSAIFAGYIWCYGSEGHTEKWLHCKVNKIRAKRSSAAFAVVISDVTAETTALNNVETTNRELEKTVAERTNELKTAMDKALEVSELKTNFISTISHEMRTSLNGIVGAASLLKQGPLNERQIKLVQMAENSVDALRRLINDVLDLSKVEAGKLELNYRHFNPEALIESVTSTMSVVANEKQLGFYIDTNDLNFSQIYTDPHRITQVLNNLLNNAIKFTNSGSIHVRAWSDINPTISYLHVEIKDTGIGIAEDKQSQLFQSFSQADSTIASNYGGTGLGLSICREILHLLGGEISVSSVEHKGAIFAFDIPLERWEEKEVRGQQRLTGQQVGLMISKPPLMENVARLIESNGGKTVKLDAPFSIDVIQGVSHLFIDIEHEQFEAFRGFWNRLTDIERQCSTVVILSKITQPSSALPQGAVNLIKPIYRSVFLSTLLDTRGQPNATRKEGGDRRVSDVVELTQEVVKRLPYRVLVVDDNEINTQVARFILEPVGANVANATNGEKAIEILNETTEDFDIILMDCNMPILNGYEATKAIRAGKAGSRYESIPIIAMTANAMKGESEKCYDAGMTDYITKPVDPGLLVRKIAAQLGHQSAQPINQITTSPNTDLVTTEKSFKDEELWDKESALLRLGGREKLLEQLLQLFVKGCESKLHAITNAFAGQDREQIRMEAHALKGNCGDVGAALLHATLAKLEAQAKTADIVELESLFDQVKVQITATLKLFESFLAKH